MRTNVLNIILRLYLDEYMRYNISWNILHYQGPQRVFTTEGSPQIE